MNFVGHLAIARDYSDDPAFWFGAMLPDFSSMAGLRVPVLENVGLPAGLTAGVALHHRTDDCFHSDSDFLRLMGRCSRALLDRGLGRGPARAAAHVGVEMLLDGEQSEDANVVQAYGRALAQAVDLAALGPTDHAVLSPLRPLLARLQEHGFPYDYRDPARITGRIVGMLAARPRLVIGLAEAPLLTEVFSELQPEVRQSGPTIFDAVRRALSARSPGHNEG